MDRMKLQNEWTPAVTALRSIGPDAIPALPEEGNGRAGQLFLPMHDGSTNLLTLSTFDPESRQPAYKACAARVRLARNGEGSHGLDASNTH